VLPNVAPDASSASADDAIETLTFALQTAMGLYRRSYNCHDQCGSHGSGIRHLLFFHGFGSTTSDAQY
jgi:hypothetical protein